MTELPDYGEKVCCPNCFSNYAVKAYFDGVEDFGDCHFCGERSVSVLPVSDVAKFLDEGIARKYEPEEGGSVWGCFSVEDVLLDYEQVFEDAPQSVDPPLSEIIAETSCYCGMALTFRDLWNEPYEGKWKKFCDLVKHEMRFTIFMHYAAQAEAWLSGEAPPENCDENVNGLFQLWNSFEKTFSELTTDFPIGKRLYRARMNSAGKTLGHEELTSPPLLATRNNRMSPVGISYFYGTEDAETAISETRPFVGAEVAIAEFQTEAELNVLDLVDIPPRVSPFDGKHYWLELEEFMKPFLMGFSDAIAQPVAPGDEPLEYVPTQVFCEFIKNNYWKHPVHGIRYKSALRKGGVSVVLFRGPEISLGPEPWLAFTDACRVKIIAITNEYRQAEVEPED